MPQRCSSSAACSKPTTLGRAVFERVNGLLAERGTESLWRHDGGQRSSTPQLDENDSQSRDPEMHPDQEGPISGTGMSCTSGRTAGWGSSTSARPPRRPTCMRLQSAAGLMHGNETRHLYGDSALPGAEGGDCAIAGVTSPTSRRDAMHRSVKCKGERTKPRVQYGRPLTSVSRIKRLWGCAKGFATGDWPEQSPLGDDVARALACARPVSCWRDKSVPSRRNPLQRRRCANSKPGTKSARKMPGEVTTWSNCRLPIHERLIARTCSTLRVYATLR